MKLAGTISLLVAAILLWLAFSSTYQRAQAAPDRMDAEFAALHTGDQDGLNRKFAEDDSERQQQATEAIVGAVFLIAGIALVSGGRKAQPVVATIPPTA